MRRIFAGLSCCCWVVASLAAQPEFEAADHVPLTHQSIYCILQDRQGFLWFGTAAGLNRYDGYEVVTFSHLPGDANSLSADVVTSLLEDSRGSLWVGTQLGLNRINQARDEVVAVVLTPIEEPPPRVHTLLEADNGSVWVGTSAGLFGIHSEGRVIRPEHQPVGPVMEMQILASGRLAVQYQAEEASPAIAIVDSVSGAIERLGRAGTIPELSAAYSDSRSATGHLLSAPAPSFVTGPLVRTSEGVWFGLQDGLRFWPTGETAPVRIPAGNDYLSNFVRSIYRDRAGTVWAGTHGGLYRYDPSLKPFERLVHDPADPASLSLNAVSSITTLPDSSLLVATFGGGINRLEAGRRFRRYSEAPQRPTAGCGDITWAILPGAPGSAWFGTPDGLCRLLLDSGKVLPVKWPSGLGGSPNVRSLLRDRDNQLVVGATEGLFRVDPRQWTGARLPLVDATGIGLAIEGLSVEPSGTIWAGTATSTLARLRPSKGAADGFEVDTWRLPPAGEGIWVVHPGSGVVWLGSGMGLSAFDVETETFRHWGPSEGLPGSVVYSILEDDSGRLWLGTNQGLAVFDPARRQPPFFENYPRATGRPAEFNRRAAWRAPSGRMFFGSMDGLVAFDPAEIRRDQQPPPVAVSSVRIANRDGERLITRIPPEGLQLAYDDYSLAFEFAALDFTNPAENLYSFQMEGFDPAPSPPSRRRFVRYTNLPPGSYTLRVRGSNEDGVWNDEGLPLALIVHPPFWETWWFRIAVLAAVTALVVAAYRYRVAKLLEMERLRLQVAGDLHDDLGSSLSGIALLSERLAGRESLAAEERRHLRRIAVSAQRMVEDLRDIVWLVDPSHDQLQDLAERMQNFLNDLSESVQVSFTTSGLESAARLSLNTRRQLFLVFKEALHNVIRHAEATKVEVRLECRGDSLRLEVVDDGVGFSTSESRTGHGIESMRRRAAALGAALEVGAAGRQGGTAVVLRARMA